MWHHFFPLLFPKDSESLKILDIRLREVGAKRLLNGTSKVNTQTSRHADIWTNRLIESIGPKGRCFENPIQCDIGSQEVLISLHQTSILELNKLTDILSDYNINMHVARDTPLDHQFLNDGLTNTQSHLNRLIEWSDNNLTKLNPAKCSYMLLSIPKGGFCH